MASSNDSTTGWQIATIVVSFLFLLAAVGAYFGWAEASKESAASLNQAAAAKDAKQNLAQLDGGVQTLKGVLGHDFGDLDGGPNTVVGSVQSDLETFGGPERQATVTATMAAMRARIDSLQAESASQQAAIAERDERLRNLESQYENRVQEAIAGQRESESALQTKVRTSEDVLAEKDAENRRVREQFETLQVEREQLRDDFDNYRVSSEDELKRIERLLAERSAELDKTRDLGFEVPDGFVRTVDPIQQTVTISLGDRDGLRPQVTFSVYERNENNIGRGEEDIKGAVEVTRILGPHQAEARILEQEYDDPIGRDDMVYSPVWQKGRTEYFAFVGKLDLDQDGTDDTELLRRVLANQGGEIDFIVGPDAERVPSTGRISERTKFLVVGDLGDLATTSTQDDRFEEIKELQELQSELVKEAARYGKRTIDLNEFLAYIGYRPTQRLYQPGSGNDYNIRDGRPTNSQKSRPLTDSLPGTSGSRSLIDDLPQQ